ncbi:MAG: hypothetical protein FJ243_02395, partial [Nitrospira sp.]|nr:hypothetical protein [Nitrospira sp.]
MSLKRSKRNKFVLVAVILFLFLSLVSAILLTQRSQEVRKEAATSPPQDLPKENYPIEKDFFQDHPLTINQPIYSLSLDADINFKSKKSFIRFILIDSNKNEYLVYETYPLIAEDNSFSIEGACEETCVLEKTVPVSLRIEGYNTVFNIKNTSFIDNPEKLGPLVQKLGITKERERLKAEKDNLKIQRLNEGIKKNGLKWIAGETLVSKLSYAEKKKSFIKPDKSPVDRLPNLQGFEFYKEGVFEIQSDETKPKAASTSNLPRSWDWRNVHGENWMTPRKAQGSASTCGYFATVGAIEALINLYYNQHLDVDLSEQMLIDCPESNSLPLGMGGAFYPECYACYPGYLLCVAGNRGLVTEECDPYLMQSGSGDLCSEDHICSTWRNKLWKFSDFHDYKFATDPYHITGCSKQTMNTSEEELKRLLIQKGPMSSAYINHGMVLTGYETDPLD